MAKAAKRQTKPTMRTPAKRQSQKTPVEKKKAARPARGERQQSKPVTLEQERKSTAIHDSWLPSAVGVVWEIAKSIIARCVASWLIGPP